jgi:hypothetical protein
MGTVLIGLVPSAPSQHRFARVSIQQGLAIEPRFHDAGRLFRFGVDTAVYFHAPGTGPYTLFVQCLESAGWGKPSRHLFEAAGSPLCQEVRIDVRGGFEWQRDAPSPAAAQFLSHWIR